MRPGDVLTIRESNEPAVLVAVLDAAGTLLVRVGEEEFALPRADVMTPRERLACDCC